MFFLLGKNIDIVIMVKKTYRNYPRKQEDSFFFRSSKINEDIITGEKLSSIYLANMELVYWSVRSPSSRGDNRVREVEGGNRYFRPLQVSLIIREHENLSNNITIIEEHLPLKK